MAPVARKPFDAVHYRKVSVKADFSLDILIADLAIDGAMFCLEVLDEAALRRELLFAQQTGNGIIWWRVGLGFCSLSINKDRSKNR